jgi:hypothetical protein
MFYLLFQILHDRLQILLQKHYHLFIFPIHMYFLINLFRVIAIQTEANYAWHLLSLMHSIPSINKLARSFLTILVLQLSLQRFRLLLQKLFTMPGKREVNYSSRSVFWPCGDCRKNCTVNSVQRDTCSSCYHGEKNIYIVISF